MHWGLDLGTSNTGLARWNEEQERPEFVLLPEVCRSPRSEDPLEAPRLVPSVTFLLQPQGFPGSFLRKRTLWGKDVDIGRKAAEQNETGLQRAFVPNFKTQLMHEPERPLARFRGRDVNAREVGRRFVRELCRQVKLVANEKIEEITVATPVEAFEAFRVEVTQALRAARVKRVRFVDEPVAAAMGYGLTLASDQQVLVVDIGGGTMHVANVALSVKGARGGACRVVAKSGRPIGGNVVDKWLLDAFCEKLGYDFTPAGDEWERVLWHRFTLEEARRVKEALFFREEESFLLAPPENLRRVEARKKPDTLRVRREDIVAILKERGFYDALSRCIDEVMAMDNKVDDVLVVGGSTLLPGVYKLLEERFGRDRVRAWLPFEAVAYGASVFAAGAFEHHDYVLHDYAIVTHNAHTKQKEYTVIVPRGTRFPTPGPVWQQKLVPTCALGEPETFFKLVVCEIGRSVENEMRLHYDESGQLKKLARQSGDKVIVPLNEENPTLGTIDPPHQPHDRKPRLEVGFTVNAERWLCVRVHDLMSNKRLLDDEPVVRVL
ncbi:MAG: Hsp70 family protein [Deltaproteobacteria bacterium]|nr:Hsp70 family protein [Deltaproteobacteria bacterium]